jgi:hypothetical protein
MNNQQGFTTGSWLRWKREVRNELAADDRYPVEPASAALVDRLDAYNENTGLIFAACERARANLRARRARVKLRAYHEAELRKLDA